MAIIVTLPDEYGYVLLATVSTFFVNIFHSINTGKARKASGIKYPAAYASEEVAAKDPKAFTFNCAQRAHANFTENLTPAIGSILIAGLKYPVLAGALGGLWSLSRVFYAVGYTKSGPQGRTTFGIVSSLSLFALKLTAAYTAVQMAFY
ncbi:membrane-associated proteins in eicosanoid and glutathione metabolism [Sordaria brevicollis]|uniref:Membrane-associated proteins in eicosanoid and glutathione metabolism n=1 Tax=Sordaria brevicollis TaxID=83679 RepID=A0AAE0PND4_SORBR|nr:membrane-associated proteins in eicosanoid and glutathione metabolism [Sordaria brevicollis]